MDFKNGDIVICLPNFIRGDPWDGGTVSTSYGGSGYKEYKIFKIGHITNNSNGFILWPDDSSNGIYAHAVRKYNDRKERINNLNLE